MLLKNKSLKDFASGHFYFGLHKIDDGFIFREWAPNAQKIFLIGDFNNWQESNDYSLTRLNNHGVWELKIPEGVLKHGMHYKLSLHWNGGCGIRIPSYTKRVVQDSQTLIFSAQVWEPKKNYSWKKKSFIPDRKNLIIYETHVGMALEEERVGTYVEFTNKILPIIKEAGYNTIQLMAIMEHPYYGSFGYHVSSFFAPSSRFGTPEELKELIDKAHEMGIAVIIDLIHSHAVGNEVEGLAKFDGTTYQYFHEGDRGIHKNWDSKLFDYSKDEILHFLLSNCRYWLEEFKIDGFRFDGITSMLYSHHGLNKNFTSYDDYFDGSIDRDAYTYLTLSNILIHKINPNAVTIAEDVSGFPGLAAEFKDLGIGFDFRLAMGVTDYWFKILKDVTQSDWNMQGLFHELTNRRNEEKTISYTECHDQALVGGKSIIFELADKNMYTHMARDCQNHQLEKAISLHKMARLATVSTASFGYLNFMGNEFGHPDWIDFPREGNNWSYRHARRQWSLRFNSKLRYFGLAEFDKKMIDLVKKHRILSKETRLIFLSEEKKIMAFERNGLYFFFNWHWQNSYNDLTIELPLAGKYIHLLDTDQDEFCGYNRIQPDQQYFTTPKSFNDNIIQEISLYLPSESAIVCKLNKT